MILDQGVCWSASPDPLLTDSNTVDDSGADSYQSTLQYLYTNTKYYVRAYAVNEIGTAYGNQLEFTTLSVTYSANIQPIFDANCVMCHSGGQVPDLRPDWSYDELIDGGYVNTDDPESSVLYTKLSDNHNARATEEEEMLILGWINEGALNN